MDERTLARFLAKVDKHGPVPERRPDLGRCWTWKPLGSTHGYGQFTAHGKTRLAHRAAYELFVDPIPPGLTIDHLCFVRECVNPAHLEAVTLAENLRRARAWEHGAAFQREKTHCPAGHPYSGDNLRICKDGKRACRACAREQIARRRERERAENPPPPKPPQPPKEFCPSGHPLAEFAVIQGGKRICGECSREKVRRYRERKRAEEPPKPARLACAHGHPWTDASTYVNPNTGQRACRACHNERSLAAYYERKQARPPKPPRTACKHGHPWVPENLYVTPDGKEKCRECASERRQRYEAKRRSA